MKRNIYLLILVLLVTSCGLRPYQSEYDYIQISRENVNLDSLGFGNVLIYNGSDVLHQLDNTERLNVWINKKSVGQLWGNEYAIIKLDLGLQTMDLQHKDMVNMRSSHEFVINDSVKVIRVEPTIFSNKVTITNELPKRFFKIFRLAKARNK